MKTALAASGGWCEHGLRARLVWASINIVLSQETRGKNYIVQAATLRRLGYPASEAPMAREYKAVLHHAVGPREP